MENWVQIVAFYAEQQAVMAESLLKASGVDVVIKDELSVPVGGFFTDTVGGMKLFVRREQAQEALSLLEAGGYIASAPQKARKL